MAQAYDKETILIIDDEPYNMLWVQDYLEFLGYVIRQCTNLNDGVEALTERQFRAAIIDLNVPVLDPMEAELKRKGDVHARYPGLYAADFARNKGYSNRQVIVYSGHQDSEVQKHARVLGCTYIIKGRPKALKEELDAMLA